MIASKRAGRFGRAAWELGVSIQEYRELEAGARSPNFETGEPGLRALLPQTFVGGVRGAPLRRDRLRDPALSLASDG
jgi:hypothetical protein